MEILKSTPLLKTKFLNFMSTSYRDMLGVTREWVWAQRPNSTAAVMVVPTVITPEGPKLCLIKEFRVPLSGYEWGFPAGLIDPGEPIENAARRELKEETGLDIVKVLRTSPPVYNSAGVTDESISVMFVEASGTISKSGHEASEQIETFLLSMDEVKVLLDDKAKKVGAKAWIILYLMLEINKVLKHR